MTFIHASEVTCYIDSGQSLGKPDLILDCEGVKWVVEIKISNPEKISESDKIIPTKIKTEISKENEDKRKLAEGINQMCKKNYPVPFENAVSLVIVINDKQRTIVQWENSD
jgi:hypothetical protein